MCHGQEVSTTSSGPDDSRTPPSIPPGLNDAVPPVSPADLGNGLAALAETLPRLTHQLRAMFFAASFQEQGAAMSDGHVLRLAVALYADDGLRRHVLANNEAGGRRGLDLWAFRDELEVRDVAPCDSSDDLPGPLRVVRAATELKKIDLANNDLYFLTPQDARSAWLDPDGVAASNLCCNRNFAPDAAHIRAARGRPDTWLADSVARSAGFAPGPEDLALARSDRTLPFAEGLALNSAFTPDPDDWAFAFRHPNSRFARHLVGNENFRPGPRLVAFARAEPETELARVLGGSPSFVPGPEDVAYARSSRTGFALGLLRNPHVPVAPELVVLARSSPRCPPRVVEGVAGNPTFTPGAEDVAAARARLHSHFARGVMASANYLPTSEDVRLAHAHPGAEYAWGVAGNPNLFTQLPGG